MEIGNSILQKIMKMINTERFELLHPLSNNHKYEIDIYLYSFNLLDGNVSGIKNKNNNCTRALGTKQVGPISFSCQGQTDTGKIDIDGDKATFRKVILRKLSKLVASIL